MVLNIIECLLKGEQNKSNKIFQHYFGLQLELFSLQFSFLFCFYLFLFLLSLPNCFFTCFSYSKSYQLVLLSIYSCFQNYLFSVFKENLHVFFKSLQIWRKKNKFKQNSKFIFHHENINQLTSKIIMYFASKEAVS